MALFLPWSKAGIGISEGIAALGILFQWPSISKSFLPFLKKSWSFWGLFGLYFFGVFPSEATDEGWKQLNIKHLLFTFPVYWSLVPLESMFKKYIRNGFLFSISIWCLLSLSSLVLPDRAYPWLREEWGYRGGGTYGLNDEHPFAYTHEQGLNAGDSLNVSVQGRNLIFCLDSKSFPSYISIPINCDTTFRSFLPRIPPPYGTLKTVQKMEKFNKSIIKSMALRFKLTTNSSIQKSHRRGPDVR